MADRFGLDYFNKNTGSTPLNEMAGAADSVLATTYTVSPSFVSSLKPNVSLITSQRSTLPVTSTTSAFASDSQRSFDDSRRWLAEHKQPASRLVEANLADRIQHTKMAFGMNRAGQVTEFKMATASATSDTSSGTTASQRLNWYWRTNDPGVLKEAQIIKDRLSRGVPLNSLASGNRILLNTGKGASLGDQLRGILSQSQPGKVVIATASFTSEEMARSVAALAGRSQVNLTVGVNWTPKDVNAPVTPNSVDRDGVTLADAKKKAAQSLQSLFHGFTNDRVRANLNVQVMAGIHGNVIGLPGEALLGGGRVSHASETWENRVISNVRTGSFEAYMRMKGPQASTFISGVQKDLSTMPAVMKEQVDLRFGKTKVTPNTYKFRPDPHGLDSLLFSLQGALGLPGTGRSQLYVSFNLDGPTRKALRNTKGKNVEPGLASYLWKQVHAHASNRNNQLAGDIAVPKFVQDIDDQMRFGITLGEKVFTQEGSRGVLGSWVRKWAEAEDRKDYDRSVRKVRSGVIRYRESLEPFRIDDGWRMRSLEAVSNADSMLSILGGFYLGGRVAGGLAHSLESMGHSLTAQAHHLRNSGGILSGPGAFLTDVFTTITGGFSRGYVNTSLQVQQHIPGNTPESLAAMDAAEMSHHPGNRSAKVSESRISHRIGKWVTSSISTLGRGGVRHLVGMARSPAALFRGMLTVGATVSVLNAVTGQIGMMAPVSFDQQKDFADRLNAALGKNRPQLRFHFTAGYNPREGLGWSAIRSVDRTLRATYYNVRNMNEDIRSGRSPNIANANQLAMAGQAFAIGQLMEKELKDKWQTLTPAQQGFLIANIQAVRSAGHSGRLTGQTGVQTASPLAAQFGSAVTGTIYFGMERDVELMGSDSGIQQERLRFSMGVAGPFMAQFGNKISAPFTLTRTSQVQQTTGMQFRLNENDLGSYNIEYNPDSMLPDVMMAGGALGAVYTGARAVHAGSWIINRVVGRPSIFTTAAQAADTLARRTNILGRILNYPLGATEFLGRAATNAGFGMYSWALSNTSAAQDAINAGRQALDSVRLEELQNARFWSQRQSIFSTAARADIEVMDRLGVSRIVSASRVQRAGLVASKLARVGFRSAGALSLALAGSLYFYGLNSASVNRDPRVADGWVDQVQGVHRFLSQGAVKGVSNFLADLAQGAGSLAYQLPYDSGVGPGTALTGLSMFFRNIDKAVPVLLLTMFNFSSQGQGERHSVLGTRNERAAFSEFLGQLYGSMGKGKGTTYSGMGVLGRTGQVFGNLASAGYMGFKNTFAGTPEVDGVGIGASWNNVDRDTWTVRNVFFRAGMGGSGDLTASDTTALRAQIQDQARLIAQAELTALTKGNINFRTPGRNSARPPRVSGAMFLGNSPVAEADPILRNAIEERYRLHAWAMGVSAATLQSKLLGNRTLAGTSALVNGTYRWRKGRIDPLATAADRHFILNAGFGSSSGQMSPLGAAMLSVATINASNAALVMGSNELDMDTYLKDSYFSRNLYTGMSATAVDMLGEAALVNIWQSLSGSRGAALGSLALVLALGPGMMGLRAMMPGFNRLLNRFSFSTGPVGRGSIPIFGHVPDEVFDVINTRSSNLSQTLRRHARVMATPNLYYTGHASIRMEGEHYRVKGVKSAFERLSDLKHGGVTPSTAAMQHESKQLASAIRDAAGRANTGIVGLEVFSRRGIGGITTWGIDANPDKVADMLKREGARTLNATRKHIDHALHGHTLHPRMHADLTRLRTEVADLNRELHSVISELKGRSGTTADLHNQIRSISRRSNTLFRRLNSQPMRLALGNLERLRLRDMIQDVARASGHGTLRTALGWFFNLTPKDFLASRTAPGFGSAGGVMRSYRRIMDLSRPFSAFALHFDRHNAVAHLLEQAQHSLDLVGKNIGPTLMSGTERVVGGVFRASRVVGSLAINLSQAVEIFGSGTRLLDNQISTEDRREYASVLAGSMITLGVLSYGNNGWVRTISRGLARSVSWAARTASSRFMSTAVQGFINSAYKKVASVFTTTVIGKGVSWVIGRVLGFVGLPAMMFNMAYESRSLVSQLTGWSWLKQTQVDGKDLSGLTASEVYSRNAWNQAGTLALAGYALFGKYGLAGSLSFRFVEDWLSPRIASASSWLANRVSENVGVFSRGLKSWVEQKLDALTLEQIKYQQKLNRTLQPPGTFEKFKNGLYFGFWGFVYSALDPVAARKHVPLLPGMSLSVTNAITAQTAFAFRGTSRDWALSQMTTQEAVRNSYQVGASLSYMVGAGTLGHLEGPGGEFTQLADLNSPFYGTASTIGLFGQSLPRIGSHFLPQPTVDRVLHQLLQTRGMYGDFALALHVVGPFMSTRKHGKLDFSMNSMPGSSSPLARLKEGRQAGDPQPGFWRRLGNAIHNFFFPEAAAGTLDNQGTGGDGSLLGGPVTSRYSKTDSHAGHIGHHGIDIGVAVGTRLYAQISGTLHFRNDGKTGYGLVAWVNGRNSQGRLVTQVLGHLDPGRTTQLLKLEGHMVTQGQLIAFSGNSGSSTAPHVHLETIHDYAGQPDLVSRVEAQGGEHIDPLEPINKGWMGSPLVVYQPRSTQVPNFNAIQSAVYLNEGGGNKVNRLLVDGQVHWNYGHSQHSLRGNSKSWDALVAAGLMTKGELAVFKADLRSGSHQASAAAKAAMARVNARLKEHPDFIAKRDQNQVPELINHVKSYLAKTGLKTDASGFANLVDIANEWGPHLGSYKAVYGAKVGPQVELSQHAKNGVFTGQSAINWSKAVNRLRGTTRVTNVEAALRRISQTPKPVAAKAFVQRTETSTQTLSVASSGASDTVAAAVIAAKKAQAGNDKKKEAKRQVADVHTHTPSEVVKPQGDIDPAKVPQKTKPRLFKAGAAGGVAIAYVVEKDYSASIDPALPKTSSPIDPAHIPHSA